jgi:hypothetical protein
VVLPQFRAAPNVGPIDEGIAPEIVGEIFEDTCLATLNPNSEIYLIPKIGGG